MSRYKEINVDTYHAYGFKRQELVDFFFSKGKHVSLGLPPMNFDNVPNEKETLSLEQANLEIEKLKGELLSKESSLPCALGEYRDDDPLLIAIKIRNNEWLLYNEDDRNTAPTADYIIAKLKEDYGMSDAQARAIEKVACPIIRK
ncbi:hypothetical protein [Pantoea sp.]|uniref:hypothetical protein n=1 Tax=Pantoea sp. TaxID=69393 RepID=UPI0028A834B3|nr:hypothetical protein [Pantoea sp.]